MGSLADHQNDFTMKIPDKFPSRCDVCNLPSGNCTCSLVPYMMAIEAEKKADMVNHPAHYTQGKIECIDALREATKGLMGIEAICTGNALKYLWRWKHKNGVEDLKKAQWYIAKLIEWQDAGNRA